MSAHNRPELLWSHICLEATRRKPYLCIKKYYAVSVDWAGELYCLVQLDWYYKQRHDVLYITEYEESSMY